MMDKLIEEVKECIKLEYARAGAQHGFVNHSDHESYAVLMEELEEASADFNNICSSTSEWWNMIKRDDSDLNKCAQLVKLKTSAMLAACECIQVAAMAHKALRTIEERRKE